MSARISARVVLTVVAAMMISGLATRLSAEPRCSTARLKGSYAFTVDGTVVPGAELPPGPFAAVGRTTYDGNGNIRGVIVASLAGWISPSLTSNDRWTFTGTYTVNSDCTGSKSATLSTGATLGFDFVVDDNLREIRFIATNSGVALSGSARKLFTDVETEHR